MEPAIEAVKEPELVWFTIAEVNPIHPIAPV